jgi:lipopolysaccharide export system permease protein
LSSFTTAEFCSRIAMKKLDKLVLSAFLSPFLLTFLVVVFILLNIQMLKYFDDLIGKGLEWDVMVRLLFYFAVFTTPTALPLAVLLSSLIAFGNLGEHFELTAVKSAGISLIRTLRPIFFFVILLTGVAFYANNNLVPKAALEAYSLLYDIKQKKPALDLKEGVFYNGLPEISIKVNKKFPDGTTLKDIIVYDHRKNDGNREVTIADSGKMYTILNERYLKFELFKGYNYTEGATEEQAMTGQKHSTNETLSRSKFAKTQVVFDLSSYQLQRTDKKWFQGNRIMRNLAELDSDIDSITRDVLQLRLNQYLNKQSFFNYYTKQDAAVLPKELENFKKWKDSVQISKYVNSTQADQAINPVPNVTPAPEIAQLRTDTAVVLADSSKSKSIVAKKAQAAKKRPLVSRLNKPVNPKIKAKPSKRPIVNQAFETKTAVAVLTDSARQANLDSILNIPPDYNVVQAATNMARQVKSQVENSNTSIDNYEKELRTFEIQWHKILASSLACIAMFLIGAPLGAIIKKGGLGVPFLVSIIFFIVYYLLTMQGEKLAKQDAVNALVGVWTADVILFGIGLIFLRQARIDARLFEADFYNVVFDKAKRWLENRKLASKTAS